MSKYFIFLLNLAGIIVMTLFGGEITITVDAPHQVKAGDEFTVEITLNKGSVEGFARLQQELPAGFTATPIENGGADFSFDMQKVKFFWLILPKEESIKLKYNVKVDESVNGTFTIDGLFSYIDGEKKSTNLDPFTIEVVGGDATLAENTEKQEGNIIVKRQKPYLNSNGEIIINLLIDKNNLPPDQFAKVEEKVPAGYQAVSIIDRDAIFSFKNNEVKFLWMTLPPEKEFLISYKLIPNSGKAKSSDIAVNGSFSYIKDGVTQSVEVENTSEDLASLYAADNKDLAVVQKTGKTPQETKPAKSKNGNNFNNRTKQNNLVLYKVQIAAGHKRLKNIRGYFRKLKMTERVSTEMHQGWIKYTVGKFGVYKQARDHRVKIWNKTKINDAFVAAYSNGQRITVQEALMIANQKWIQ